MHAFKVAWIQEVGNMQNVIVRMEVISITMIVVILQISCLMVALTAVNSNTLIQTDSIA